VKFGLGNVQEVVSQLNCSQSDRLITSHELMSTLKEVAELKKEDMPMVHFLFFALPKKSSQPSNSSYDSPPFIGA